MWVQQFGEHKVGDYIGRRQRITAIWTNGTAARIFWSRV